MIWPPDPPQRLQQVLEAAEWAPRHEQELPALVQRYGFAAIRIKDVLDSGGVRRARLARGESEWLGVQLGEMGDVLERVYGEVMDSIVDLDLEHDHPAMEIERDLLQVRVAIADVKAWLEIRSPTARPGLSVDWAERALAAEFAQSLTVSDPARCSPYWRDFRRTHPAVVLLSQRLACQIAASLIASPRSQADEAEHLRTHFREFVPLGASSPITFGTDL